MIKDYFKNSVKKMIVIGESNAFGMCASDSRNEWAQTVANLIRDFQDEPLIFLNNAIPSNVISPTSPGYKYLPDYGLPSALERYKKDVIDQNPDLTIIAYGLNDSRCGNPVNNFIEDLQKIVSDIKKETKSMIVLASPYWNTQYNEEIWNNLKVKPEWSVGEYATFAKTGRDLVWSYVTEIEKLSHKHNCLFVDLFSPTENCIWLLHEDNCHFNDIGQKVIGQIIFNKIACSCSFIGKKSKRIEIEGNFDISNTGGTGAKSRIIEGWLKR
ncbi:MAG: GDSL-type esterase/lipase family protein [Actinobacteria bacterium]|nr:GDSL-type esterase/lipase family protein [Cyanobacteriota bacterium]MCL5772149.1 GDSL-type esterase/lipase family protein [Actinomycetota bacterium]